MASAVQGFALPEYSVPMRRRQRRPSLDAARRHLHFAEPAVTTIDDELAVPKEIVCQAALSEGEVCDSCYAGTAGLIQVDGVTLDCSSSDELRALRGNADSNKIETDLREIGPRDITEEYRVQEESESDDESGTENEGDLISDGEIDEMLSDIEENDAHSKKMGGKAPSTTSSASSCDGDSVIYLGQRDTFKGVEELVVTAEESLCLQAAESARSLELTEPEHVNPFVSFAPPSLDRIPTEPLEIDTQQHSQPAQRSNSADSGVCSQPEVLDRRSPCGAAAVSAVVAIDLGTTHSGYAYSVCREPGRQVHIMRRWEGADSGLVNHKTPTVLLLTPTGAFHSFGSAARDFYHDLPQTEARRWQYFERFKMCLHRDTELHRDTPIAASNGKTQPALVVFAHSLKHFKEFALRELSERCGQKNAPDTSDIRWVVTVPAIWRQPARQLIREAAYQAGLCDSESAERLLIVLEPEAAAVQCREQLLQEQAQLSRKNGTARNISSKSSSSSSSDSGSNLSLTDSPEPLTPVRFLVADCGGGTVDITLHELSGRDATLRELLPATGGPFGATGVDKEFESLLAALFGQDLMAQFKEKRPAAHTELLMAFEGRKRCVGPLKDHPANLFPPYAFVDFFRKHSGKEVEYAIKKNGCRDITWCRDGVLRFQSSVMLQLFKTTVQKIVEYIKDVLEDPILSDAPAQFLFLVGGFSDSEVLQKAIKDEFGSQIQVISPQPSSLATLRGAVLYGLDTNVISARRAKHSYGVGVLKKFMPGLHPASKLVISKDGQRWCADVLDCFVTAGQSLSPGHAETRRYVAASSGQRAAVLNIYCASTQPTPGKPQYVTDEGVTRCGTLTLSLEDENENIYADPHQLGMGRIDPMEPHGNSSEPRVASARREVNAHMFFSGNELVVSAIDTATGKCVRADVDFLAGD
ncbi:heat shock 70 kDa protein 12A-like [Neocloeon triangulifer]|uniref:heat shock 70 kDa protein 12A-like n=1 Tax=Neocloeon triangulifer TaxID=2078957 RepID=UPI00286F7A81|nr:heat shock 70 kDa protein 12A-like [Neocloeon triangulifer]